MTVQTIPRDLIVRQGAAFTETLPYAGVAGRGQRMHIRTATSAATVVRILSHNGDANSRVIFDGSDSIVVTIGASISALWLVGADRVEWVYDIEDYSLSDVDDVEIPYSGKVIVYGNRTRAEDVTPSAQMPSGDGRYVRFDGEQTLTTEQKLQARENIGAGSGGSGSGDVVGPASSTDGAIAVFDGTSGKLLAEGTVTGAAVAAHLSSTSNPHSVTAAQVGADAAGTASSAVAAFAATLGDSAGLDVGTTAGTVAAGDHTHTQFTTQSRATWEAGVGTTESVVSPAKVAAAIAALGGGGTPAGSSGQFQYNDASAFGAANLWWISANALAQRNSTKAQALRVNDTYTDDSNQAYLEINPGAAGDWMQIHVVTVGTAADNYGLALTPSGFAALSAHLPDSTTAGGNARGTYSTDWQRNRSGAIQVASGSRSTISGGENNTASASYTTVSGGDNNTSSGQSSVVGGGSTNTASGANSWVPGGKYGTTRGLSGAYAHAADRRSAAGDAQVIGQPVRRTTAATTTVQLSTDGASPAATTVMVLPNNSGGQFEARVSAYQSTGCGGWKIEGTGYRGANAAATVIQGTTTITAFGIVAGIGAPTVDVVADTTLGALVIQITPANATSTYWVGKLELIQVA